MKNSTLNILKARTWKNRKTKQIGVVTSTPELPKHNILVGSTDEQQKDDFLSRLGNIAYAKPQVQKEQEPPVYDSRWFFVLPDDYAESNKNDSGIQQLPERPQNIDLYQRLDNYKNAIGQPVQFNMRIVSNYILTELSPALLGFQAGVEESRSIMEHTVGELDNYLFNLLELMTREALKRKLSLFIVQYFGLSSKDADAIIEKVLPPKQREVVVPVPVDTYARPKETKDSQKHQS